MRELDVRVALPVAPAVALRTLFDDEGRFFTEYHAAVSKCPEARVTRWDAASRTRTVCFLKRLDLPAALTRVLGDITSLQVSDVQTLTHAGCNGDGLATVTSTPLVPIKAVEKFKTQLVSTIERGDTENACVLHTKVTVDAPVFGLQTLIERQMAAVAEESLATFNAFALEELSAFAKQGAAARLPQRLALEPASPRKPTQQASDVPSSPLTRAGSLKRRRSSAPNNEEATDAAAAQQAPPGTAAAAITVPAPSSAAAVAPAQEPANGLTRAGSLRRRTGDAPTKKL